MMTENPKMKVFKNRTPQKGCGFFMELVQAKD
jgi:hypothetical protein